MRLVIYDVPTKAGLLAPYRHPQMSAMVLDDRSLLRMNKLSHGILHGHRKSRWGERNRGWVYHYHLAITWEMSYRQCRLEPSLWESLSWRKADRLPNKTEFNGPVHRAYRAYLAHKWKADRPVWTRRPLPPWPLIGDELEYRGRKYRVHRYGSNAELIVCAGSGYVIDPAGPRWLFCRRPEYQF